MDTSQIQEHMQVVGSDGQHVGTVDGIEGSQIKLTKSDPEAQGVHHFIPLTAVAEVTEVVTLTETAENTMAHWDSE